MEENIRIDKYLAKKINDSRENITKMINEGYILVNGKNVKPSYKIKLDDDITIKDGFKKEMHLEEVPMDLDIVYEDEYLMVINKPSGLVVHPGSGNMNNTLVNGLLSYTHNLSHGEAFRPGIVHRLDKDTSGLMLVAKTDEVGRLLSDDFKNKRIHREYVALLDGIFPEDTALIDAPIGRSTEHFDKMAVTHNGKKAITHVKVIKRYNNNTLVRLVLDTGRTHQIRVHLSYIGYPIHNDPVYNKCKCTDFGQFLHSEYIKFTHPITKEILEFKREVPDEFKKYIDTLS